MDKSCGQRVTSTADPRQKAQVLGETPERDVLPVVRRRLRIAVPARQGLDRAAKRRTRFEQGDFVTGVDQVECGGQAREPAADHNRLHSAATARTFSTPESSGRAVKTS